jgi:hypothetical protein
MSTTTQTKHEVKPELYVFRYNANRGYKLPERTTYHPELDAGVESFIQERGYHLLPGLTPALETYESEEAADRFLIVAHYGQAVLVIFTSALQDYTKFLEQHFNCFSVWPHVFMPPPPPTPDNHFISNPVLKPVRW